MQKQDQSLTKKHSPQETGTGKEQSSPTAGIPCPA